MIDITGKALLLKAAIIEKMRVRKARQDYIKRITQQRPYLIYRDCSAAGFFSFLYTFFAEIEFAASRRMIPVIDMGSYMSQFGIGNGNIWEYFFHQPAGVSPEELYAHGEFSHCHGCIRDNGFRLSWDMKWVSDFDVLRRKREIFNKYIRPKKCLEDYIHAQSSIFDGWNSTVGVSLRGTCYTTNKPFGHPVQPNPEKILERCEDLIESGEIDSVYLATIDSNILSLFVRRLGRRLIKMDRPAYPSNTTDIFQQIKTNETIIDHCMSYISSVYLFRNCKRVIGGVTSSSVFIPLICPSNVSIDIAFMGYYGSQASAGGVK